MFDNPNFIYVDSKVEIGFKGFCLRVASGISSRNPARCSDMGIEFRNSAVFLRGRSCLQKSTKSIRLKKT